MTIVAGFVTVKVVEPRLGKYNPMEAGDAGPVVAEEVDPALDSRGLRNARLALLGVLAVVLLCTLPPGAPLRDPQTGDIIGQTPFMASLLFIIMLCFLIPGIAYGATVGKYKHANDVIASDRQDVRRAGRPDLHAVDDQPVHRLLQLQPDPERDRRGAGRRAGQPPASARSRC